MTNNSRDTKGTILVIDDDEATRQALADLLASERYATIQAGDGVEALALLLATKGRLPEIILLDVQMTDMDGHAFRRAQSADEELASIPVLVMTAEPKFKGHAQAFRAAVLYKPFNADALFEAIAREIERGGKRVGRYHSSGVSSGVYPCADQALVRRRDSA